MSITKPFLSLLGYLTVYLTARVFVKSAHISLICLPITVKTYLQRQILIQMTLYLHSTYNLGHFNNFNTAIICLLLLMLLYHINQTLYKFYMQWQF